MKKILLLFIVSILLYGYDPNLEDTEGYVNRFNFLFDFSDKMDNSNLSDYEKSIASIQAQYKALKIQSIEYILKQDDTNLSHYRLIRIAEKEMENSHPYNDPVYRGVYFFQSIETQNSADYEDTIYTIYGKYAMFSSIVKWYTDEPDDENVTISLYADNFHVLPPSEKGQGNRITPEPPYLQRTEIYLLEHNVTGGFSDGANESHSIAHIKKYNILDIPFIKQNAGKNGKGLIKSDPAQTTQTGETSIIVNSQSGTTVSNRQGNTTISQEGNITQIETVKTGNGISDTAISLVREKWKQMKEKISYNPIPVGSDCVEHCPFQLKHIKGFENMSVDICEKISQALIDYDSYFIFLIRLAVMAGGLILFLKALWI